METLRETRLPPPPAGSEQAIEVRTAATVATSAGPGAVVTKVIVAVHGVGEQHTFATIQAVANQFCSFYREPAAIPLGSFHTTAGAYSVRPPYSSDRLGQFAFAEVYWATIPRELVSERHTLEEAKKWARTIVGRLHLRARKANPNCTDESFQRIGDVLTEMVQTIAILDRLSFVADKAGLFTFDLRKILDDFLGDVQVVAEFESQRRKILDRFAETMTKVYTAFSEGNSHAERKPDIYIVAHSEGSVVAFLGLLEGTRDHAVDGDKAAWVDCVRGLMTIGSPIDKHLVLWPELFSEFEQPAFDPPPPAGDARIEWRNYFDRGDPIGFELDLTREWLGEHGWNGVFNFESKHDFGFDRYTLPGKAHVDYWTDDAVFGHFIQTVVQEKPVGSGGTAARDFTKPPGDISYRKWFSYIVPYVGVTALIAIAAFILHKAFIGVVVPEGLDCRTPDPSHFTACELTSGRSIFRHVAGTALLVLGLTAVGRIPRLTQEPFWRLVAIAVGVLGAFAYRWSIADEPARELVGLSVPPATITLALAALLIILVYFIGARRPNWGMTPLILLGTAIIAGKVGYQVRAAGDAADVGPVWPVLLATAAFLYLWWLAALLLDLVFVWHVYIRQSKAVKRMCEVVGRRTGRAPAPSGLSATT